MQDITILQDALIADEINRIESLTRMELIRELIEVKSRTIEKASPDEVLRLCRAKHHND